MLKVNNKRIEMQQLTSQLGEGNKYKKTTAQFNKKIHLKVREKYSENVETNLDILEIFRKENS